jgi:hypothetical protein
MSSGKLTVLITKLAAEQEMLDAAQAAFHSSVSLSSGRVAADDANLSTRTRTELMQQQVVPRHGVRERKLAREDTKEGVHKRSRKPQEWQRQGAHGKGPTEWVKMHGRVEQRCRPWAETLSEAG